MELLSHVQKYFSHAELTHMLISVTYGDGDALTYRNISTSHKSEILHSFIFLALKCCDIFEFQNSVFLVHLCLNLNSF